MTQASMKKTITGLLMAATATLSQAGGLEALEQFITTAKSGRADFTQVVSSPAKDGQVRSKTSSGTFEFQRPSRFRFAYRKPFEQVIVADGKTLWLHDPDLNQVTSRSQSKVLGATPAALVAASPDFASLRRDFEFQPLPDRDGQQWVQATPRQKDGQVQSISIGFRGRELATLDITDGLGQRSLLTFSRMELNVPLAAGVFQFKVPAGADLVTQ